MPLELPTLPEVRDRAEKEFRSRLALGPLTPRGVLHALVNAIAAAEHSLAGYIAWAARQPFLDTCEQEFLDRWGSVLNRARKAAAFASGPVVFTGATNGTVVPAGTLVSRPDGRLYAVDQDATVVATVVSLNVTATVAGADGDAAQATVMTLGTAISGIPSTGTTATPGISGGADLEEDEKYRVRLIARMQSFPATGTKADYKGWTLENPGATRAWVLPNNQGAGTVGVTFVRDDDPAGIVPTAGEVAAVQAYLDARAPVPATVAVFAPTLVTQAFTVQLVGATSVAVQDAVKQSLKELLVREGGPGATIYLSHIREAISLSAGEVDHLLVSPTANLVYASGQVPELGTVTFV